MKTKRTKKTRAKVLGDAVQDVIRNCQLDEAQAKLVLAAIAEGRIRCVTVNF